MGTFGEVLDLTWDAEKVCFKFRHAGGESFNSSPGSFGAHVLCKPISPNRW